MMKLKTLAVGCLILFPLIGCDRERATAPAVPPPPASAAAQAAPAIPEFSLTLPESWSGRYRMEKSEGEAASRVVPEALQVVEYLYQPITPELQEQPLLMVIVLKQNNWQAKQKEGPPLGEVLAAHSGYVYVAALPQANPYGKKGEDAERYDALRLNPNEVKAGFALPQG